MIEDDTATIAILDYVEAAQELGISAEQAALAAAEIILAAYAGEYDPDPVSVTH